ncbi:MAG: GntR family transcriptional regulator [Pseudomonadota bacterium]
MSTSVRPLDGWRDQAKRQSGRTPHLHEQVFSALSSDIVAGRLQVGERLTEEAIAARFGVSRGPARRALLALQEAHLVNRTPGRGLTVTKSSAAAALSISTTDDFTLDSSASWEAIYSDAAAVMMVHAAYGNWRIVETEFAEHYDVGRTVARDVLARLEHCGILRKSHGARWALPKMTHERTANLYEMRRALEPVALRQAVRHAPRALLIEMHQELEDAIATTPDLLQPEEFDRLEKRLHIDFLAYAENELLRETLVSFRSLLVTNTNLYLATRERFGPDPYPKEHLEIVESLLDGRVDRAAKQLAAHMDTSVVRMTKRLSFMTDAIALEPLGYFRPIACG